MSSHHGLANKGTLEAQVTSNYVKKVEGSLVGVKDMRLNQVKEVVAGRFYVDSHGVAHLMPVKAAEIENGYK